LRRVEDASAIKVAKAVLVDEAGLGVWVAVAVGLSLVRACGIPAFSSVAG
jgi:hypothetical protein